MQEIRIGLVGLGARALDTWLPLLQKLDGFKITALCDPVGSTHPRALERLADPDGVTVCSAYQEVLDRADVDAIALTVRSEDQGELAARALESGKHVHAEVPGAHRIEDCWRIVRAVERTGLTYQLAEQTRYWGFVDAWRRLVADGELGKITFAEGQYFHYHPGAMFRDPETHQLCGPDDLERHPLARPTWSQLMPPIHYLPHELSPLLSVIDDRVVEVVGMSTDGSSAAHPEISQPDLQVALMKTAKGSVLRLAASFVQPHPDRNWHWYQITGTAGRVEWRRADHDHPKVWRFGQGPDLVDADWGFERPDAPAAAHGSGHGDADYYTHIAFRDAVLAGRQPDFDVYRAMDATAPAILAATSIEQGSRPLAVPDFRNP